MNDVDLLVKYIERDPDDLTAVACLTDALIYERDMTRSEADRYAERTVQAARDARDMTEAARLLTREAPGASELLRFILLRGGIAEDQSATVCVCPGDAAPKSGIEPRSDGRGYWSEVTVTVGALWVTRHSRLLGSLGGGTVTLKRTKTREKGGAK